MTPHPLALAADAPWHEVWRLWTAHLVHYGPAHAMLNAGAAVPPMVALGDARAAARAAALQIVVAPIVSLLILAIEQPYEYRGASALVVGLWIYAGLTVKDRRIGIALIVLCCAKLVVETMQPLPTIEVAPLALAHWLGAAAGLTLLPRARPS